MVVSAVRAGDPRPRTAHAVVGHHPDPVPTVAVGTDVPLDQGGVVGEVRLLEQPPPAGEPGLPVPGQEEEGGTALGVDHRQALQHRRLGHVGIVEELDDLADPRPVGCVVLDHRWRRGRVGPVGVGSHAAPGGRLDVGGVAAGGTADELVLTDGRRHHELVVHVPTDGPRLRLHRGDVQSQPGEDPEVGVEDRPVRGLHGFLVHVEGVGVGHDELAGPQQTEAGPGLVPELDLDLVDGERQLAVRLHLGPHRDRDHLFVGGPQHEGAAAGVHGHGRQDVTAEQGGPAGLFPQLDGMEGGEEDLLATGGVEFLADDPLHPGQHPHPQGQEGVHPRGQATDVPGPHQ